MTPLFPQHVEQEHRDRDPVTILKAVETHADQAMGSSAFKINPLVLERIAIVGLRSFHNEHGADLLKGLLGVGHTSAPEDLPLVVLARFSSTAPVWERMDLVHSY